MHPLFEEKNSLDQRCYKHFKLSPEILMEHAGMHLAKAVAKRLTCKTKALFVCGNGNNGADGLVAARLLHGRYDVAVYLPFEPHSALAKEQYLRAKALNVPFVTKLHEADVYVDALFGSGLNRPLDAHAQTLIETLNEKKGMKIACDIPSGLSHTFEPSHPCFCANETVVMGALSVPLFFDSAKEYIGKLRVATLGVSRTHYEIKSDTFVLQKSDLHLPKRMKKNVHKGTFGHVAIVAANKEGAAILAGMGAFYFGAGLVSLIAPTVKKIPPYLMHASTLPSNSSVIVAGMGLEMPFDEPRAKSLLCDNNLPLVIDAFLCTHPLITTLLDSKKPMVLTPHPKEFTSLLKLTCNEDASVDAIQNDRFGYARRWSKRFSHVVLVLKGANTLITHNGTLYVNPFGTQALAKGGSGDVLSGMIGALIAQGYETKEAAIHASLAHALVAKKIRYNNFALTPIDLCKGLKWL